VNQALKKLLGVAAKVRMTDAEREEQRISFSYGSAKIENERVTEEMVREAARKLKAAEKSSHG
jgi:Fic family protein